MAMLRPFVDHFLICASGGLADTVPGRHCNCRSRLDRPGRVVDLGGSGPTARRSSTRSLPALVRTRDVEQVVVTTRTWTTSRAAAYGGGRAVRDGLFLACGRDLLGDLRPGRRRSPARLPTTLGALARWSRPSAIGDASMRHLVRPALTARRGTIDDDAIDRRRATCDGVASPGHVLGSSRCGRHGARAIEVGDHLLGRIVPIAAPISTTRRRGVGPRCSNTWPCAIVYADLAPCVVLPGAREALYRGRRPRAPPAHAPRGRVPT